MLSKAGLLALFTTGMVVAIGCHHDKYGINTEHKEEVFLPPVGQARFDQPPTEVYQKPRAKSEDKSLMGGKTGMGGRGLSPGF